MYASKEQLSVALVSMQKHRGKHSASVEMYDLIIRGHALIYRALVPSPHLWEQMVRDTAELGQVLAIVQVLAVAGALWASSTPIT